MEVQLIYNVVLISVIQQSDSVISYIYIMEKNMKKNIYVYKLFYILFHYSLSQDIDYSFLCYTVGPCSLSILCILVFIC